MKTNTSILTALIIFISISAFSQLKVASNGYVGINQPSPAYNLDWFGTGRYFASYGALIFDSSGYGGVATIHPYDDWNGCLGRSDKKFNVVYAQHVITDLLTVSDERVKQNITTITNSLDKIKKLHGVSYDIKPEYFKGVNDKIKIKLENEGKNQLGFLAQELKEVFPNSVFLDTTSNLITSISFRF